MADNPIIIDLAKLKIFKYAQIDILNGLKEIIKNNNTIIMANNEMIAQLGMTIANNLKALQNLESNSTRPDDGKTEYFE